MGDLEQKLADLRRGFRQKLKDECQKLESQRDTQISFTAEDLTHLRQYAHKMAGSAGTFGLTQLSQQMKTLELEMLSLEERQNPTREEIDFLQRQLITILEQVPLEEET